MNPDTSLNNVQRPERRQILLHGEWACLHPSFKQETRTRVNSARVNTSQKNQERSNSCMGNKSYICYEVLAETHEIALVKILLPGRTVSMPASRWKPTSRWEPTSWCAICLESAQHSRTFVYISMNQRKRWRALYGNVMEISISVNAAKRACVFCELLLRILTMQSSSWCVAELV